METSFAVVQGKEYICPHCEGRLFEIGTALLNTPGMTFFGLDWANRQAKVLTCTVCGHVSWFAERPPKE